MSGCPDASSLEALLLGTADAAEAGEIAAHLDGCAACATRVAELERQTLDDDLAGRLAALSQLPIADTPLAGRAIARVQAAMALAPAADDGRPRLGDYVLESELGRGGMGVVYRAWHPGLRQHFALKVIRSEEAEPHEVQRFLAEARAAARLRHPGIVSTIQLGEADGQLYMLMPLVEGETLSCWLKTRSLPPRGAIELICACAEAIGYAHREGVVHRDLKPQNIMVDGSLAPKILDFGLARDLQRDTQLTQAGDLMGTPSHMSPEQFGGQQTGPPSDIWSLGVILYQLLTGEAPFKGRSLIALGSKVATADPELPRQLNRRIPRDAEAIALRCLEKDPAARYPDGDALAADCRRMLTGHAVQARHATVAYRAQRWLLRRRAWIGAAALLLLAIFGGARWTQLQAEQQRRAQDELVREAGEQLTAALAAAERAVDGADDAAAIDALEASLDRTLARAADEAAARLEALPRERQERQRARFAEQAQARRPTLRARLAARRGAQLEALVAKAPQAEREELQRRALAAYARAFRLDPDDAAGLEAALRLGRQYLDLERHQTALEAFRTVVSRAAPGPLRDAARESAGEALWALGRWADARATWASAPDPRDVRARAVRSLAARFAGRADLGLEGYPVGIGDLDGQPGQEVLLWAKGKLSAWRWNGEALRSAQVLPLEGKLRVAPAIGDVTGDGRPEVLAVVEGGGVYRLQILGGDLGEHAMLADIPLPKRLYTRGPVLLDVDGDGALEIYLPGRPYAFVTLRVTYADGRWQLSDLDPKLRSSVYDLAIRRDAKGNRTLLATSIGFNDYAIHSYRLAGDKLQPVARQGIGEGLGLHPVDLDGDGSDEVVVLVTGGSESRNPWRLGDDLEQMLPGGLWVLKADGDRLRPHFALRSGQVFPGLHAMGADFPVDFRDAGRTWLTYPGHHAGRGGAHCARFVAVVDGQPLSLMAEGTRLFLVGDLDGDGVEEAIVRQDKRLRVIGLGPIASGGTPLGAAAPAARGGEHPQLELARDLRRLQLADEARVVLSELLREPLGSELVARAANALIDLELAAGDRRAALGVALREAERCDEQEPMLRWRAAEIQRDLADREGLAATVARLEALALERPELRGNALERLRLQLKDQAALEPRVQLDEQRSAFVSSDPLLAQPGEGGLRLAHLAAPHWTTAPAWVGAGPWRFRATVAVEQIGWSGFMRLGLFDRAGRSQRVIWIRKRGNDWNMDESLGIGGRYDVQLIEGRLASAERLTVTLWWTPSDRLLRATWALDGRQVGEAEVMEQRPLAPGWYRVGIEVGATTKNPVLYGTSRLLELSYGSADEPSGEPPVEHGVAPSAELRAAAALLADAPALTAALRAWLKQPANAPASLRALLVRYPGLSATARSALQSGLAAAAGADPAPLVSLARSANQRPLEALLALETLPRLGNLGPQGTIARTELQLGLQRYEDALAGLAAAGETLPAWYRQGARGRALLGRERFEEALPLLAAAVAAAPAAEREQLEYNRRKALWKGRKLRGEAPQPSLAGYRIDAAFQRLGAAD